MQFRPGLTGGSLASPGEVAGVKPEGAVLLIAAPDPHGVDPLGRQLGHGGGAGQLELPLLPANMGEILAVLLSRYCGLYIGYQYR